jgi:hypothetical protein
LSWPKAVAGEDFHIRHSCTNGRSLSELASTKRKHTGGVESATHENDRDCRLVLSGAVGCGDDFRTGGSDPSSRRCEAPAGDYSLIAAVTDSAGATLTSRTPAPLMVAAPTIVLAATVTAIPPSLAPNRFLTLSVTLSNTGNINSTGVMIFSPTLTATGGAAIPLAPFRHGETIRPGAKPTVVRFRVHIPSTVAAAAYAVALTVEQGGVSINASSDTSITVT